MKKTITFIVALLLLGSLSTSLVGENWPILLNSTVAGSTNGTSVTTSGIVTTGANLIVAAVSGTGSTVSDSASNTWSNGTEYQNTNCGIQLFYVYNPTTNASHTFTATSGFPSIAVLAIAGAASSPFDQENGASIESGHGSLASGNITPTTDYSIMIGANGGGVWPQYQFYDGTPTIFGIVQQRFLNAGQSCSIAVAFGVQKTAAAIQYNAAYPSSSGNAGTVVTSFKSLAGTGGGTEHSSAYP